MLNSATRVPSRLRIGPDTVALRSSPLNEHTATIPYLFGQAGWLALGDSTEVFVADSTSAGFLARRINDYIRAQRAARFWTDKSINKPQRREKVNDWVWLALFVLSCTALWIEPKLT